MKPSRRSQWFLRLSLVCVLGGCKDEVPDKPAVDPLDDPWVDAIDTGDEQAVVAVAPEAPPSTEPSVDGNPDAAPASAETGSLPEAEPSESETEPDSTKSPTPAAAGTTPSAPATPDQPAAEAPAANEPPPEPTPIVEPTPPPSSEPPPPPSPPPITSADFHGSYRYIGGSSQRADVTAAIEDTVVQLNRAIQGIARRRLTEANPVDSTVQITVADGKITTSFESGFDVTCVIDGGSVQTKGITGEKLSVTVRAKGSKLIQHLQGKDGARTIVYTLSADRKTLSVHHKITADRLPAPITYKLSYSRK